MKEKENHDFIVCQICNKRLKRITKQHLKIHDITKDEYVIKYPNAKLICEKSRQNYSKAAKTYLSKKSKEELSRIGKLRNNVWWKKYNNSDEEFQKEYKKKLSVGISEGIQKIKIESPDRYKKNNENRSIARKKLFKKEPEKMKLICQKGAKSLWDNMTDEKRKNKIENLNFNNKKWWNNLTSEEKMKRIKNNFSSKKCYEYDGILFRSKFEVFLAEYLDKKNINYLYEPFIVHLENNKEHLIDFYIPDLNLILECKSTFKLNVSEEEVIQETLYKQENAIKQGYNYLIIWYDKQKNLITKLDKIFKNLSI